MKRGTILVAVFLFLALVLVLNAKNNDFLTSFVTSEAGTFDINVDLYPLSREIQPGEGIRAATRIDTHKDEKVDVTIQYTITDNSGLTVFQKSNTLAVEKTAQVNENLMIHKSLEPGSYLVDVEVIYDSMRKTERDTFTVVKEKAEVSFTEKEATLLLVVLLMLIIFFILLVLQHRQLKKLFTGLERKKIDIHELMEEK